MKIDKMPLRFGKNISVALAMDTGFGAYPNIYFGKEHIGGIDDIKGLM